MGIQLLTPIIVPELSVDPSTPSSGFLSIFANASGQVRVKNDAGTASNLVGTNGTNASNPSTVRLGSDVASTGTTLIDATGLSFSITSGNVYAFEFYVRWVSTATTNGIWLSINAPANNYLNWNVEVATSNTAATLSYRNTVNSGAATTAAPGANDTGWLSIIRGLVNPTANGTLIVRFAEEVSAQTSTIKAGSSGLLWTL